MAQVRPINLFAFTTPHDLSASHYRQDVTRMDSEAHPGGGIGDCNGHVVVVILGDSPGFLSTNLW